MIGNGTMTDCRFSDQKESKEPKVNLTRSPYDQIKATMQTFALTIYAALLETDELPFYYPLTDRECLKHMPNILANLQALLPNCSVKHALMSRGSDGQLYDIEMLTEKTLPLVDKVLEESYIVVESADKCT